MAVPRMRFLTSCCARTIGQSEKLANSGNFHLPNAVCGAGAVHHGQARGIAMTVDKGSFEYEPPGDNLLFVPGPVR